MRVQPHMPSHRYRLPQSHSKEKNNIPLDIGNSSYRIGMRFPIGYTFMEFPVRRYQFGKGIRIGRQFKDGDTSRLYKGLPQTHKFYEANDFTHNRKVHLFGEAYVEVTKDAKHPFSVVCNNATIKVLGTKFNVQSHESDSEFEVMLYEGCVDVESEFNNKQVEVLMAPGDIVKIDKTTGNMSQMNISTIANQGQSRKFYFIDKKLEDITNQLERHFQKKIVITNPQLKSIKYDAIFANDETIEQILNYLNASQQMSIIYHDNTTIEIR